MTEICKNCGHELKHHYGFINDKRKGGKCNKCKCKKFEPKNYSQQKRQNTAITSGLDAGTSTLSEKIEEIKKKYSDKHGFNLNKINNIIEDAYLTGIKDSPIRRPYQTPKKRDLELAKAYELGANDEKIKIKEAIKRLKDFLVKHWTEQDAHFFEEELNKIFGDKLT